MHHLQIEYEYWVGKEDNLLYKSVYFDTASPSAKEIMPLSEDHRQTVIFYDFNQEITIQPPLDSRDNLLPGWFIQQIE